MKFAIDEICTDKIELNTMAELRAYALGCGGKITIDFLHHNEATGEITEPLIESDLNGKNEDKI